jgi:hypothetical protein
MTDNSMRLHCHVGAASGHVTDYLIERLTNGLNGYDDSRASQQFTLCEWFRIEIPGQPGGKGTYKRSLCSQGTWKPV